MKTTGSLVVFLVLVNGLFAAPKLEPIIQGQDLAGWVVPAGNDQELRHGIRVSVW
jgi:hypothetical protein